MRSEGKIRVVLVTQGVSAVSRSLASADCVQLVGITESAPREYENGWQGKLRFHTKACIDNLLRGSLSLRSEASTLDAGYFLLHKRNIERWSDWLVEIAPDLVVVFSMSQLIPSRVLDIPRFGTLNLHPSLLPAYRGPNPWFWMYYHQEPVGGITLHHVDAGEDTGDIVFQGTFPIPTGIKLPELVEIVLGRYGAGLILQACRSLSNGKGLPRTPQPCKSGTDRARNLKPSEHRDVIDWSNWSVDRIWHVMRGTESWLNCIDQPKGLHAGQRWEVLDREKCSEVRADPTLVPKFGQVLKDGTGYYVRCRDGVIRLKLRFRPTRTINYLLRTIAARCWKVG